MSAHGERAGPRRPATKVSPDETELITRALANDTAAVRAIMQRNNRRLYRIARGVVRNDSEAEDIVQAAYGQAFTHLNAFDARSSISTWLVRIVLNEAMGRIRRRRDTVDLGSPEESIQAQIIPFPTMIADPERTVAQREIQALLERAIDNLPEPFRLALVARAIEGMSVEETSELLGIRPETVKTRVHRARALLKSKLEHDLGPALTSTFPFAGTRCERLTSKVLADLQSRSASARPIGESNMANENPHSTASIAQHPIHPMLIPFPIAFFVATFLCDLAFWGSSDQFWASASLWLLGAGLVMSALAAIAGLTDVLGDEKIRRLNDVWLHAGGNIVAVLIQVYNFYLRYNEGSAAVIPTGTILSALVVAILLFTGWKGWELVYRHRVGVSDRP